jgi:glycosyltransferase involved in cell wall biosynthesis
LHAFGYGLPVVTHCDRRLHGPEIAALEDGGNGLLFARNDTRDLVVKLSLLLKDEALRRAMAASALDTVNSQYTLEHMVENLESAIMLASKRAVERSG